MKDKSENVESKVKVQVKHISETPKPKSSPITRRSKDQLVADDVPPGFTRYEYIKSENGVNTNLLIVFPGIGNDFQQYVDRVKMLNIPQCCYLIIQPTIELPYSSGFCWYPLFDNNADFIVVNSQERRRLGGLKRSRRLIYKLMEVLISKYKWNVENMFLLGFSQGATMAIDVGLHSRSLSTNPFGGIVAIADSIFEEALLSGFVEPYPEKPKCPSSLPPICISHGIRDQRNPLQKAKEKLHLLEELYKGSKDPSPPIEWHTFDKGHQMISTKQEAKTILHFLSSNMKIRRRSSTISTEPDNVAI